MDTANEGYKPSTQPDRHFVWVQGNGKEVPVMQMEDSHLLHTIVKIERDGTPSKMGRNNVWVMLPILMTEVKIRRLEEKLAEYRIRDAKNHGDTRRLVIAVANKEKSNGNPHAEAKGDVS